MPAYDVSLWDFLKYASTQTKQKDQDGEFFPLSERIEMKHTFYFPIFAAKDRKSKKYSTTMFFDF